MYALAAPQTDDNASPNLAVAFVRDETLLSPDTFADLSRDDIGDAALPSKGADRSLYFPLSVDEAIEVRRLSTGRSGSVGARELIPEERLS